MKLQILLLIFLLNFCKIITQNEVAKNSFQVSQKQTDNSDIDDTPSPEWIRYQQERFKDTAKLFSKQREFQIKTKSQPETPLATKVDGKMETSSRQESSYQEEKQTAENSRQSEENTEEKLPSAVEFPSLKGFIEFVKSLKQTWMKNSLFRIDDKIQMLHQLKNSLLKTIEQQFLAVWQNDEDDEDHIVATKNKDEPQELHGNKRSNGHLRTKRGILDESSINFPPDAALMSINFLTFAVFLIKLVLQVVNIVKTKHYQFTSMNMDTGAIRTG